VECETREILLKADKVAVVFERIEGGKIRVTTSSWVAGPWPFFDSEMAADFFDCSPLPPPSGDYI
jgi:hypothetical protein